jgi:peptidoglycan/LPS O-acetylase OafA/YrhL
MKLRRITTHGNWIPEIDGLRFVAIAATIFTHILGETLFKSGHPLAARSREVSLAVIDRGGRGVLLFFAISGFILAQPFLRQHLQHGQAVSIKAFYKRRLTRLEPPYILSLLVYTFAFALHEHRVGPLLTPLFAHIFYVHNFFPSLRSLNFVTWSLEVEVQFYILAPLLGCLYAISSTPLRRSIIVALILASVIVQYTTPGIASWDLPGELQFFMVGFLLADLRATRTESQIHRWWDLVTFVVWIAIFAIPGRYIAFVLPPLILLAYLATFNGPITRQIFRTPWIALTGGMCYSFYLMHMLIISIAFPLTRRFIVPSSFVLTYLIQALLLVPCIFLFCTAYFVLVERPCMEPDWPRRLTSKILNRLRSGKHEVAETTVENN